MLKIETKFFFRISKAKARNLYEHGEKIYLCAHKMDPDWASIPYSTQTENATFDEIITSFTSTICNKKRGRYPLFYIKKTWGGNQK